MSAQRVGAVVGSMSGEDRATIVVGMMQTYIEALEAPGGNGPEAFLAMGQFAARSGLLNGTSGLSSPEELREVVKQLREALYQSAALAAFYAMENAWLRQVPVVEALDQVRARLQLTDL